jgi:hypothetical protein
MSLKNAKGSGGVRRTHFKFRFVNQYLGEEGEH